MPERKRRKTRTSKKEKKRTKTDIGIKVDALIAEDMLKRTFDSVPDLIVILDKEHRIVQVNKSMAQRLGMTPEQCVGLNCFKCMHKLDAPPSFCPHSLTLADGKEHVTEIHEPNLSGDFLVSTTPLFDSEGKIIGSVHVARDITQRKKAEKEIKSLSRFPSENPNVVMRISKDGNMLYSNKAGLTILNEWKCQAGQPVPVKWQQLVADVFKTGTKKEIEEEHDGQTFLIMFAPIIEEGYVNVYGRDITERKKAFEDLKRSEDRYRSYIEVTGQLGWTTNGDGEVVEDIPSWTRFTGQTYEEAKGSGWTKALHPDDRENTLIAWKRATCEKSAYEVEYRIRRKDGIYRQFMARGVPICGKDGTVREWVGTCIDITERKKAEEELRKARDELELRVEERTKELKDAHEAVKAERKRFFDVLEKLPAYMVLLTPDYHVSYANRFFRERFGEDMGRRCFEYLFNRSEPCEVCETYKTLKKMGPLEWEWTGPDGHNYYIYDSPFTDVDGSTLIMEVGIDITERKKAEEAVRKAHEELEVRVDERTRDLKEATWKLQAEVSERKKAEQSLLESQTDLNRAQAVAKTGSWRLNVQRNELLWSDETYRMFGIPRGTPLTYETFLNTVYPEDREYVDNKWQAATHGEPYDIEHRILVNEQVKWVREKAELEFDKNRAFLGGFGTVQDITEIKEMHAKLEEYSKHLEQLVEQKTQELKEAERMATIGETAGMVGHDIRNPLQSIEGSVYLAKEELESLPDSPEKKELKQVLEIIRHQTHYIDDIVADLQDFSRTPYPELKEASINELIREAVMTTEVPTNIQINRHIQDNIQTITVDPVFVKRMLTNLIENAVHAMPNGGQLTIKAFKENECIHLHLEDTGRGIPEEHRTKIFTPLFTTKSKGQGFGLAVCKKLVEAHNGEITFESQAGKGTTFKIKLPQRKETI